MSFHVFAIPVDGKITYKLPSGSLVDRIVTIDVPERGQGEVILTGEGFEWKTKIFKAFNSKKQTFFTAAFHTEHMNKKSTVLLKGTYLKGTNRILYYGDIYKFEGHVPLAESLLGFDYIGAFNFGYDR